MAAGALLGFIAMSSGSVEDDHKDDNSVSVEERRKQLICSIREGSENSHDYAALAILLTPNETVEIADGHEMDARQLLLQGLGVNPRCWRCHAILAHQLDADETINVGGVDVSKTVLLLASLHFEPANPLAYYGLSEIVPPGNTILLTDGRVLSRQQLLVATLERDLRHVSALSDLAETLGSEETVQLADG